MALVCGFIPMIGFLSIAPGLVALRQIKVSGQRGRMAAIVGLTFGWLWLLSFIVRTVTALRGQSS